VIFLAELLPFLLPSFPHLFSSVLSFIYS
jgi:hypothetical protein